MKSFYTGIPFFDKVLSNLEINHTYGIRTNYTRLSLLFIVQSVIAHLKLKKKVIILCNSNPDSLIDEFLSFDFDIQSCIENQDLIILEQPPELDIILSSLNNIEMIFDDLQTYIKHFEPDFIYFESLKSFIPRNNVSSSKVIINRLISILKNYSCTHFIDFSNIDYDLQLYFEKQIFALFSFKFNYKGGIHYLTFRLTNSDTHHDIAFSIQSQQYFVLPQLDLKPNISINEIDTIFLQKEIKSLQEPLSKMVTKQTHFIVFDIIDQVIEKLYKNNNILFLPINYNNVNGLKLAYQLKNKLDTTKIVIVISHNTNPNQKVRILRLGIDHFLEFPYTQNMLYALLTKLFPVIPYNEKKLMVSVLFNNDVQFNSDNNHIVYFDNVFRVLKEYIYKKIAEAGSIQFVKIKLHGFDSFTFIQILKQYQGLSCILSNQISENDLHLIAIFINIQEKTKLQLFNHLKDHLMNTSKEIQTDSDNALKNIFLNEQKSINFLKNISDNVNQLELINYPFDEVNFDHLIKKLFDNA